MAVPNDILVTEADFRVLGWVQYCYGWTDVWIQYFADEDVAFVIVVVILGFQCVIDRHFLSEEQQVNLEKLTVLTELEQTVRAVSE